MPKRSLPRPTDAELSILRVLWKRGPSTVRQVHEELEAGTGYTTVLKFLQIMTEKGLVSRDDSDRSHIYRAALPEQATQRQLIRHLVEKAFGGSAQQLVLQALSTQKASPQELMDIRKLIDELQRGAK